MEHQSIDLSICIASFGNDVGSLIEALLGEIAANPSLSNTEILISDQCSEAHPLQKNWTQHPRVHYHHYTELRGRAANRNHLVALSKGTQLLFLDADALPVQPNFIAQYLEHAAPQTVLVGGTAYHSDHKQWLRYKVGVQKESIPAKRRSQTPYSSFSAFNVCMDRAVAQTIAFDAKLLEYGHEDTLFGLELRHRCVPVKHLDNPAYHLGIDSDEVFMEKTKTAVLGLAALINAGKIDEDVRLYATYKKLQSWGGALLLRLLNPVLAPWMFGRLSAGRGSVAMFDLYKLVVLCAVQPTVGRKIS